MGAQFIDRVAECQPAATEVSPEGPSEQPGTGVVEHEVDGEVGVVQKHEVPLQHVRQRVR